jgi:phage protein D
MIRVPEITITYEGKDITADIAPYVRRFTYTDVLTEKSSDISLELEDKTGNWLKDWYPKKGSIIKATIAYKGETPLDCGAFQLDDFEFSFPPSIVTLGALATDVKLSLREKRTEAYEKQTLKDIATKVAERHGLTLKGEIKEIKIERCTQDNQTDLEFLVRIAKEYNYLVKIENGDLIFWTQEELDKEPTLFSIDNTQIASLRVTDKRDGIYKACEISYQLASEKEELKHTEPDPNIKEGDILKIKEKCETKEQAIEKAKAALKKANSSQIEATINIEGIPDLLAGINFDLEGFGAFAGKYQITEVTHTVTKNRGWECRIRCRKIDPETAIQAGEQSTPPTESNGTESAAE